MSGLLTEATLNFEIGTRIGKGGEGEVFEAIDHQLNAKLAIKVIPQVDFKDESHFYKESKKLYLSNHRNVVPVNYGCKDTDYVYLAMPYYSNGSLKSICDKRFLTTPEILRYSIQFLSGLNHIHTKGLLHFDVKLENILVSDSNQALISDFGLAEFTGHYGFAQVFGTTQIYAPPELFTTPKHNNKYDIYQAGITIYRMCIGDTEFINQINWAKDKSGVVHDNHLLEKLKAGDFPVRNHYYSHIPKKLRKVISTAMDVDPANRYPTVIDMLNDLSSISDLNEWQFDTDYSSFEQWTSIDKIVKAEYSGTSWSVHSTKKGRKKTEFCETALNISKKNSLTYKALMANW